MEGLQLLSMIVTIMLNLMELHTQPGRKLSQNIRHLVDCSARELKKVVPSRDITPCRRKEPLMRRSPNGTSYHFGDTHICEEEPAELKHLSRQRKRNQTRLG
jgi:hypothetical protein